jgi:hypothetical protein
MADEHHHLHLYVAILIARRAHPFTERDAPIIRQQTFRRKMSAKLEALVDVDGVV